MFPFGRRRNKKKAWELGLEASENRDRVSELCKAACRAVSEHQFEKAIECFGKALELAPDDYLIYEMRAVAHESNGDFVAAAEDFERLIHLAPESASRHALLGVNYRRVGRFADANCCFEKAKQLDPDDSELYEAEIARTYEEME